MKQVDVGAAQRAYRDWLAGDKSGAKLAVRYSLQKYAQLHPGRAVEVRVVPYGAAQILTGVNHRRGTPPAVIEMDGGTWLELCAARINWEEALAGGRVTASGERASLAGIEPVGLFADEDFRGSETS